MINLLYNHHFNDQLPRFTIFPFIFCSIIYWMVDLNNDIDKFFICCAAIILCSLCAVSLGSFLSAASPSLNVAIGIAAPILVPLMIFSGYFLNNEYKHWLFNVIGLIQILNLNYKLNSSLFHLASIFKLVRLCKWNIGNKSMGEYNKYNMSS